jgi:hypothetical protein
MNAISSLKITEPRNLLSSCIRWNNCIQNYLRTNLSAHVRCWKMDSLYTFKCKRFRNARHTVTFGIPSFPRRTSRWLSWTSNEAFLKLFHCSLRNTWATVWLGMVHRSSGLNKIIVPRVNCRSTVRFLAILSVKFPLNLCSSKTHNEHALHLSKQPFWFQLRERSRWRYWVLQYHVHQTCNVLLHYDSSKRCVLSSVQICILFQSCKALFVTLRIIMQENRVWRWGMPQDRALWWPRWIRYASCLLRNCRAISLIGCLTSPYSAVQLLYLLLSPTSNGGFFSLRLGQKFIKFAVTLLPTRW